MMRLSRVEVRRATTPLANASRVKTLTTLGEAEISVQIDEGTRRGDLVQHFQLNLWDGSTGRAGRLEFSLAAVPALRAALETLERGVTL